MTAADPDHVGKHRLQRVGRVDEMQEADDVRRCGVSRRRGLRGEASLMVDSFVEMGKALLLAVLLVYLIMAAQFQ